MSTTALATLEQARTLLAAMDWTPSVDLALRLTHAAELAISEDGSARRAVLVKDVLAWAQLQFKRRGGQLVEGNVLAVQRVKTEWELGKRLERDAEDGRRHHRGREETVKVNRVDFYQYADIGMTRQAAARYRRLAEMDWADIDAVLQAELQKGEDGHEITTQMALSLLGPPELEPIEGEGKAAVMALDAIDLLKSIRPASIDLLLTDPPYSTDVPDIVAFAEEWVPLALKTVRPTGRAYICTGAYPEEIAAYLDALGRQDALILEQVLVWTYRETMGPQPRDRYVLNWQAIFYLRGPEAPRLNCPLMIEQWAVHDLPSRPASEGHVHTWQKPMELAERFIRHSTEEGMSVLDPFAGTGTFLAAAVALGRNGLGAETDAHMLERCAERGLEIVRAS